jgi:flagellar hook-length control protein FliK
VSSTPSVTSDANVSHVLASQRWQALASSQQQGDSQSFAALLDAAPAPIQTAPPATANTSAASPQSDEQPAAPADGPITIGAGNPTANAMPRASAEAFATANAGSNSAAKWRAAGGGKWRNAATANTTSEPADDANTNTSADTNPNTPNAQAAGADAPPTNNDATTNDSSRQTSSANPNAGGGELAQAAAAAVAAALNPGNASSGAPTPSTKDGADDTKTRTADSGNATPSVDQPSPNQQPVAAALVVNTAVDAGPVAANGKSALAINEQAKPRSGLTPAIASNQNTSATDASDTSSAQAATQSTANDQSNGGAGGSGANGNAANPSQPQAGAQQSQAQTQANAGAVVLAQNGAAATGGTDRVVARGDAIASTVPSGATGATNGATANNADVLPSFGFLAANATATGGAAAPAASTGAAVPLAGLAVAIAARAQAGSNQFDIRLDPPELGRIDVRLDVDSNGQVTSHVTVDRPDTLQLLQSHQPQLEQALQQAGLKTTDNGLQFTLRDQSFAGQNSGGNSGGGGQQNTAQLIIPDAQAAPVDTAQIYSRLNLGSGLDIRV